MHGRGFKPAAVPLLQLINAALRAGVERDYPDHLAALDAVSTSLAYYGDLSNALLESKGKHYDAALDLGDRRNALASLRGIPARKRFGIRQYDCLPGKSAVPEFIAYICTPILGALGLTLPLIASVSRDFSDYLAGKTPYAEQVRERVRTKLCEHLERGDRLLLITHGTGCAVAYDVLWQLSHDPQYGRYRDRKVDTWLTLGGPLGDLQIRKRLLGARSGANSVYPTNVITWYNVAAEDDYTCSDGTLANDFRRMLQQHLVSTINDFRIYNLALRFGKSNPHSSVGYYIHPRVSKIIVDWIEALRAVN